MSEIVAPALSTAQDESSFQFQKYQSESIKRPYFGPDEIVDPIELRNRIKEYYSLDELSSLLEGPDGICKYKKATLQFPDELVSDSALIVQELQARFLQSEPKKHFEDDLKETLSDCKNGNSCSNCSCQKTDADSTGSIPKFWVLADTSYSSCCIDEVAAEHVSSALVIHFGDACLSPVQKLDSVYVFGKPYLNLESVIEKFKHVYPDPEAKIILMADAPLSRHISSLYENLLPLYPNLGFADLYVDPNISTKVVGYQPTTESGINLVSRNIIGIDSEDYENEQVNSSYELFQIGVPEAPRLLELSTNFASVNVYDPATADLSTSQMPALMRRYRFMHMARAAGTVGILVNTLSLQNTKTLLNTVAKAVREAGKKHYTFVVGKPNVAKLANFESIDIWCVLGCGQGGIIVDGSNEYYKPIVTPYELKMALSPELTWTGKWVTDFKSVLGEMDEEEEAVEAEKREDGESEEPVFNPVTGQFATAAPLRSVQHLEIQDKPESASESSETQLVKNFSSTVTVRGTVSTSAIALQKREWTGLGSDFNRDEDVDQEDGALAEEGTNGVARGYDFDVENRT